MKLATVQASAIKSTFEVLKDILNDVNIYFKPDARDQVLPAAKLQIPLRTVSVIFISILNKILYFHHLILRRKTLEATFNRQLPSPEVC